MAKNKNFSVEFSNTGEEFFPLDKDLVTDSRRGVPKNTPKETLSKLGKYSKNVLVSVGKLTVDVGGKFVPNAQSFATSLIDTAKLASAEGRERLTKIKEFVAKNKSVDNDPAKMMDHFVKSVSDTKKDIIKRLKSGEFYKRDVDNFDMSGMFGDDGDMDDFSFGGDDFDFGDMDSGSTFHGDPETQLSDEPFGDTITTSSDRKIVQPRSVSGATTSKLSKNSFNFINVGNSGQTSNGVSLGDELVSGVNADIGKAIMSQQDRLFDKNFAAAEMRFSQHMEVQRGILSALNASVDFLQNVTGTSSSAGMEFQGKMIGMQQEQLTLLKEIKEASILAITPPTQSSSKMRSDVVSNGEINSESYWKNIKNNAGDMLMKTSLGPLVSMLPMLGMMGDMGDNMGVKRKFDPLSFALKTLVSSNVSMKTKAKLGAMNDLFSNAGSLFIGKMNDLANNSDNKYLKMMGQLLGVKDTYVKQTDFGLKDPDKIVGWSAKSDRTLNHVIPTQLGEIISALTGKEPEFYDYKEGKFTTKKEKKREYENLKKAAYTDYKLDETTNAMSVSASKSEKGIAAAKSLGMSADEYNKALSKDFRNIRLNIGATQSKFNPEAARTNSSYRAKLLKNVSNEESLELFIEQFGNLNATDSQHLWSRASTIDRAAKERMARFGEDSLKYGGADVASDLQSSDEVVSLEDRLTNGFLSKSEIDKIVDPSLKTSRLQERARIIDRISKLRSGSGTSLSNVAGDILNSSDTRSVSDIAAAKWYNSASATLAEYGISADTGTQGSQQNVYSTLNNIYSLLVGGILVYPQQGRIPKHIIAAKKLIKSKGVLAKSLEQMSSSDSDRAAAAQEEATLEESRARRIREQMAVFGPSDFYMNIFGLRNEERRENSTLNKGFNKGLDAVLGGVSKLFGNGNVDSINSEIGDAYSQYMQTKEADLRRDIAKGIADAESSLESLKGKTSASAKAQIEYYTMKRDKLKKILARMDKVKANGGVSSSGLEDIVNDVSDSSSENTLLNKLKVSEKVPEEFKQFVSEGVTTTKNVVVDTASNISKKAEEAKKTVEIIGTTISYINTVPDGEKITKEELRDAIEISAIDHGKSQEEAKAYVDAVTQKITSVTTKKGILEALKGIIDSARSKMGGKKPKSIRNKAKSSSKKEKTDDIKKTFDATSAAEPEAGFEEANFFDTLFTDVKGHAHLDVLTKLAGKGLWEGGKAGVKLGGAGLKLGASGLGLLGKGLGAASKGLLGGALNLAGKAATKMTGQTFMFDKLEDLKGAAVNAIFTTKDKIPRSKEEIEEDRKAVRAAYNSIDALEQHISGKLDPDEKVAKKQLYKLIDEQIRLGALDKTIGTLLKDGVAHFVALGYPPEFAFTKMKDKIREKYDKSYKKEMRQHNPFLKVAKGLGKWTGVVAGSTLAIASGNPIIAVALVGDAIRRNPTIQRMVKNNFDKKSTTRKLKRSLDAKAVNKYGAEVSAFDAILGITAMSKLSDKELQHEQELAAATFKALEQIEIWANENVPPSDLKGGDTIAKVIKESVKKGAIDESIGNMVIDRIKDNVAKGKPAIEALAEAKATIQKNYSKVFKKEQKRRGLGSKLLRGFGKGIGIAAVAMYNPLLAALLVGKEVAAHRQRKRDKEAADQRDEINEIRGTYSVKEKSKADKDQERKGLFAKIKGWRDDRRENARLATKVADKGDVETEPTDEPKKESLLGKAKAKIGNIFGVSANREGSFEDQKNDKKAEEKEAREKEQLAVFKNLGETLTSIRRGLGILDKGEHIDEKDTETFAGKLDEILGATKTTATLQAASAEKSNPGFMSKLGNILIKAGNVAPKVVTGLGVAAVAATAAVAVHQTAKGIKRWKEEGWQNGVGELTGLDKQSDSMFNPDGTRKEADFHVGGENGFDVDLDRAAGRAPAKRVLINAKTHMTAVNKAGQKIGSGLKNLGKKLGGSVDDVAESAAKSGIPSKILGKVKDCLEKFFKKGKVKKMVGEKGKDIISKIMGRLKNTSLVKKMMAKGTGKNLLKQIPLIGMGIAIIGAVTDFVNGMSKTNRYFKISAKDNATIGMKISAGLAESLPGLLGAIPGIGLFAGIISALIPPDWIAQTVYKFFASKKEEEELAAKQEAFQKKAEELGVDPDRLNEYENKSLGQKFVGLFKSKDKKDAEDAKLLGFGDDVEAYREWKKKYDAHGKGGDSSASDAIIEKGEEGNAITGTVSNAEAEAALETGKPATQITPDSGSTTVESSATSSATGPEKTSEQAKAEETMEKMPETDKQQAEAALAASTGAAATGAVMSGGTKTISEEGAKNVAAMKGKLGEKGQTVASGTLASLVKTGKQALSVKESPFVTNDKMLMQQLEATLAVQKEIRDEMFRHNSSVEQFITYMVDYLEKGKKANKKEDQEKKKEKESGGWFANIFGKKEQPAMAGSTWSNMYSTSDSEMAYDADSVATGTSS